MPLSFHPNKSDEELVGWVERPKEVLECYLNSAELAEYDRWNTSRQVRRIRRKRAWESHLGHWLPLSFLLVTVIAVILYPMEWTNKDAMQFLGGGMLVVAIGALWPLIILRSAVHWTCYVIFVLVMGCLAFL